MQGRQLLDGLPLDLTKAAVRIAKVLAAEGERAWIVGGALRDLVRGRAPKDVDMVSAVTPERVEELFENTHAVGRAFGTVIVVLDGVCVELTTFRVEEGHTDARRPDRVHYGLTLEEDALRRDFTCNALYLDPLNLELRDPTGGLDDLRRGVLRTVGEPCRRFAEDGLRLLRMARFEAAVVLEPAEGLHAAARESLTALRGVSAERVLAELTQLFCGPHSARGLRTLEDCGVLAACLPGDSNVDEDARASLSAIRMRALDHAPEPPGEVLGLAILLEVDPLGEYSALALNRGTTSLEELRASRQLREGCRSLWRDRRALVQQAQPTGTRAGRIRLLRGADWTRLLDYAAAWQSAQDQSTAQLEHLRDWRASLPEEDLHPNPWLAAEDLSSSGLPRGPLWAQAFAELERMQLDEELNGRAAALAWLVEFKDQHAAGDGADPP